MGCLALTKSSIDTELTDDDPEMITSFTQKVQTMTSLLQELKAEYEKQLSILNEKYKDENVEDYTSSVAFKEEIDKMINEID